LWACVLVCLSLVLYFVCPRLLISQRFSTCYVLCFMLYALLSPSRSVGHQGWPRGYSGYSVQRTTYSVQRRELGLCVCVITVLLQATPGPLSTQISSQKWSTLARFHSTTAHDLIQAATDGLRRSLMLLCCCCSDRSTQMTRPADLNSSKSRKNIRAQFGAVWGVGGGLGGSLSRNELLFATTIRSFSFRLFFCAGGKPRVSSFHLFRRFMHILYG
jgi:hypothetical protein